MDIRNFQVTLRGVTPLLMHYDNISWSDYISVRRDEVKRKDKANFSAGDDRCPEETWKGYLYVGDRGDVMIPVENLQSCLMKAGASVVFAKQKSCKQLAASGITFEHTEGQFSYNGKTLNADIIDGITGSFSEQVKQVDELGFKLFVKRARIGKAKHVRVRPMFRNWSVVANFSIVDDQLTDKMLADIWGEAGLRVGIGDWRPASPQSPGIFGKFTPELKRIQ